MPTTQTPLVGTAVITTNSAPAMGSYNRYNATSGSLSAILPTLSAQNVGARLAVQKYSLDVSANTVTFTCAGTDKFDDGSTTSFILDATGEQREIQVISISGVKRWKFVGTLADATGGGGGGGTAPTTDVSNITALRALASSTTNTIRLMGYYAAGDGGGGLFRWDGSDTTSTDNGGTIITPTSGLSTSGRWKRIYEGEVNARWFGMHPNKGDADNTAPLQAAINWVATDLTRDTGGASSVGGTVFIPMGYYRFRFDAGTSGLSTITIPASNITIRGEGYATYLTVRGHTAVSDELDYFFTFNNGGVQGFGGGIEDLVIDANEGQCTWGIYLPTWHGARFLRVVGTDLHGGLLDAESNNTAGYSGEGIIVRECETRAANAAYHTAQFGVRFRASHASNTGAWSDSWIEDCFFSSVWDAGVLLDGLQRFTVRNIVISNNATTSNTISGTSKDGVINGVRITTSYDNGATHVSGWHLIDGVYFETHPPGDPQTPSTNIAVQIEIPTGIPSYIRGCRILNIKLDATPLITANHASYLKLIDTPGTGKLMETSFSGSLMSWLPAYTDMVSIGATVVDTHLDFQPTSVTTNAPGATPTVNSDMYKQVSFTGLAAAITSMTTNATPGRHDGQLLDLRFKDNGTARAITWGTLFTGTLLSTTVANKTHLQRVKWDSAAGKWAGYSADTAGY